MTTKTKNILINIAVVIGGYLIGAVVNMFIVGKSGDVIPLPAGINPEDMKSLKDNIHLFEAKHYIMPFLAHAMGTLISAFLVAKFAATNNFKLALGIGVLFLFGGIAVASMLGTPFIPSAIDIAFAYLPMAWIGAKLAKAE